MIRFFLWALLLPSVAYASGAPIERFTLKNGLEVIVIENHRVPAVSHMLWYRVGAADDPPGKSGLAHYHEHAMFLGTPQYPAGSYGDIVTRHGGQQNAFTGPDATSYYIDISKDQLPLAMELEADRMRGITAPPDDMAKEKQVIIEERRMRVENNPQALLSEQVDAALFRHHPYRLPIIGWMDEMETLAVEDVSAFHRAWYHPGNAILIVSGDVTAADVKPLAEKYYGDIPSAEVPVRHWNAEPPHNAARRVTLHHQNVQKPQWQRTYAASSVAYGSKDEALPLFVLADLLGTGKSARLYRSLVVEQKLATGVDVDYNGFTLGPATFTIRVTPEHGVAMEKLEAAVDGELVKLLAAGVSDGELARAQTLLKSETAYARDSLSSVARIMGWLRICGLEPEYFNRWPQMIEAVTAAQVATAARDTLRLTQSVTALLLPEEGK